MNIITDFNPDDFVIKYFKYKELCCRECLKENKLYFVRDDLFLNTLRGFRFLIDTPIIITSGTRCQKHNSIFSKYSKSYHISGQAADFYTPNMPIIETYRILINLDIFNGIGIYPQTRHNVMHIDVRKERYYWVKWESENIPLF